MGFTEIVLKAWVMQGLFWGSIRTFWVEFNAEFNAEFKTTIINRNDMLNQV